MATVVGVDVGGTFTDFFALDSSGDLRTWKRLSTPAAPEEAVLAGLDGIAPDAAVVHGSTVATNALLERRGPRTFLIVTDGFKDILEIRRQDRPALYDLEPRRRPHVVRRGDVITVRERLGVDGDVVLELDDEEVARVVDAAWESPAEAFALCLLHSYAFPAHERRLADALRAKKLPVVVSSEVHPEMREYERASTTAVNAFLQPGVAGYLEGLREQRPALRVLSSSGGLVTPGAMAQRPADMVMSGPAGGVLGAIAVARQAGFDDIITFDMGGTSTDVSLVQRSRPAFVNAATIDGLAVHVPMVDVVTVGAGGGSIARRDAGGALLVGPESAGADPGPACYGLGTLPTVTDANLLLGRLSASQALGGSIEVDMDRARQALATLGTPEEAAQAVVEVVNSNMARAVRAVSMERGFDPTNFTMVAFGGAGPLHGCELADAVGIRRVLVPLVPGVLSALGMVTAPDAIEEAAATIGASEMDLARLARELGDSAKSTFEAEFGATGTLTWSADARYRGQAHELRVDVEQPDMASVAREFHIRHRLQYGFADESREVECVVLRARVEGPSRALPAVGANERAPIMHGGGGLRRAEFAGGDTVEGPAVIVQDDATTFVPANWRGTVDPHLNLILEPVQ